MRLDERRWDIAYSTVGLAPINTVAHYRRAALCGFPVLKGDIRPTSDGRLVMCHDAGFTTDETGLLTRYSKENNTPILQMTYARCLALRHAPFGGKNGLCEPVCGYEDYIRVCKQTGRYSFTTIRNEAIPAACAEMFRILRGYGMEDRVIVNSFTYEALQEVRRYSAEVPVSFVQPLRRVLDRNTVDMAAALGNAVVSMFSFAGGKCEEGRAAVEASADAIAYAHTRGVTVFQAIVSTAEEQQFCIDSGFAGMQIQRPVGPWTV